VTHYVASFSDITQRKQDEAEIFQLAFYDPLTQLPNRRQLLDRLRQVLDSRGRSVETTALLCVDIDHFKVLNDIKGRDVGDLQLIEIARRLLACSRKGDTVARLGADEFVVLLAGLDAEPGQAAAQAKAASEKIQLALNQPYWLKDFEHHSACRIGISMSSPEVGAQDLLQHANTALYEAKAASGQALRFFDPAMQSALEARAQLKAWEAQASTRDLVLAVNVSARQFGAEDFVQQVESLMFSSGIAPARLKLEITESMLLGNVESVISTMRQLKALGLSFSLDDFGTGYSSLQYLKRLPLDQIKIDQSFVRDISSDSSDQAIVRTIVAMAHSMNLDVIAEGVETDAQRQLLERSGCANYQGYLFARPLPLAAFEALLQGAFTEGS
jgi:diguanylate cyclase (GGDEF)-like protein